MADVPHFAFPFRFGTNHHAVEVEQDSPDDIAASVAVLLSYPIGFLPALPTFGVIDQLGGANLQEIRTALAEWEPRVGVDVVITDYDLRRFVEYVQAQVPASEGGS